MANTDEEQVEELKRWWRENGSSVVAGVVIALAGLVGWQQWQAYQERTAEAASGEYLAFLELVQSEKDAEGAVARGQALIDDYDGTPYAGLTALWLAQYHVEQASYEQAAEQLRWAASNADGEALASLARLRLARVLLAAESYDEALAQLAREPAGYAAQYREVRGDVYAARGEAEQAASAYGDALAAAEDPAYRAIIELKLNDLGLSEEPVS